MRVVNVTRGSDLATSAHAARTLWSKTVGLLGHSSLAPGEGLIIEPCSSVHTAFMRFPIDVVFLSKDGTVEKAVPNLRPFRVTGVLGMGYSVIELPAGTVEATGTVRGDRIILEQ